MEHLASVRPGRQEWVVTQDLGVAEPGALLVVAVDLHDRRVEIDRRGRGPRSRTERPGAADRCCDHRIELADVPEGERPQEGAERGGRHHPEGQHPCRRPCAQAVGVVDVGGAGQDRRHQRQYLATRKGAPDASTETHRLVHQRFETQAHREGRRHEEPCCGHQRRLIEGHPDPLDRAR
jgi:hypothetical protein